MSPLNAISYVADAWILLAYAAMTRNRRWAIQFDAANAIGCVPLLFVEVLTHAWPVMPLTASFGAIGTYGLVRELKGTR